MAYICSILAMSLLASFADMTDGKSLPIDPRFPQTAIMAELRRDFIDNFAPSMKRLGFTPVAQIVLTSKHFIVDEKMIKLEAEHATWKADEARLIALLPAADNFLQRPDEFGTMMGLMISQSLKVPGIIQRWEDVKKSAVVLWHEMENPDTHNEPQAVGGDDQAKLEVREEKALL